MSGDCLGSKESAPLEVYFVKEGFWRARVKGAGHAVYLVVFVHFCLEGALLGKFT